MPLKKDAAVTTEHLSRTFGARCAVDAVSLNVAAGEALALFGPNGAGKTTLLRMLAGLLRPTSGKASISGMQLPGGAEIRRRVGVISHQTLLYDALTARENIEFTARLYRVKDPRAAAETALERMRMTERADTPVRALSRGMKQRISIARAIVHDPFVILADEPYTGLDVLGARALTDLLLELRSAGAALILVTHSVDEGLSVATSAATMLRGRIERVEDRGAIEPLEYARRYHDLVAADG